MRRNNLGYLGFLGLLGLLGLVTENFGSYGFFGYFGFFAMLKSSGSDERIDRNINRACGNAFAFTTIVSTISVAYAASTKAFDTWPLFLFLQSLGVLIFGLSYTYYNGKAD
jgi:hypothetical protein